MAMAIQQSPQGQQGQQATPKGSKQEKGLNPLIRQQFPNLTLELIQSLNRAFADKNEGSTKEIIEKILGHDLPTAMTAMAYAIKQNPDQFQKLQSAIRPILFPENTINNRSKISAEMGETEVIVKVPFNEETFTDSKKKVEELESNTKTLIGEVEAKATAVSGDNIGILDITAASTMERKKAASAKLDEYIPCFNAAVRCQNDLIAAQSELLGLKKTIGETLQTFLKETETRIKHLTELFSSLANEHNCLKDQVTTGGLTLKTRYIGGSAVKVPTGTSKDRYAPIKDAVSSDPKTAPDSTNFSDYFKAIHEGYRDYERFIREVEKKQLNKVSGTRKSLFPYAPNYVSKKEEAERLVGEYPLFHDRCLDLIQRLNECNWGVKALEGSFNKLIEDQIEGIQLSRKRVVMIMKELYEQHKKLDSEKLKEDKAKHFKEFTLQTVDLHDGKK